MRILQSLVRLILRALIFLFLRLSHGLRRRLFLNPIRRLLPLSSQRLLRRIFIVGPVHLIIECLLLGVIFLLTLDRFFLSRPPLDRLISGLIGTAVCHSERFFVCLLTLGFGNWIVFGSGPLLALPGPPIVRRRV